LIHVSDLPDAVLNRMSGEDRAWVKRRTPARCRCEGAKQGTWSVSADLDPETGAVVLRIPYGMPSINVWTRWHWTDKQRWLAALTTAAHLCKGALIRGDRAEADRLPYERARVQVVHHFASPRRRDADNYAPKALLDALRHAGWIVDDNAKVLDLPQPVFVTDGTIQTEVHILRLEGVGNESDRSGRCS
jgi:hypothetical protein